MSEPENLPEVSASEESLPEVSTSEAPAPETPESETPAASLSRRQFVALAAGITGAAMLGDSLVSSAAPSFAPAATNKAKASSSPMPHFNRAPLQDVPFAALPLGSVKARGWLLKQLELQRDGLTGHAEELLPAVKPKSAWRGGDGEDWEKGPYYVKGLIPLAYTIDDANFKAKIEEWVNPILNSQRDDGYYGPQNDDWWPRMVVNYLLRDYAEATGDERVVPFLRNYYHYMVANLPKRPLRDWGKARAGDEIDTIFWLYNRTGEAFLLDVADLLHQQAYAWTDIFTHTRFLEFGADFHPKHNVNVPQALKMPPVYWQRSKDGADRAAFDAGIANLTRDHGLAVGINSGTEFLAGRSASQGIELCSIVERMLTDETALRILGDAKIGDNLEMLAFNALPAAISKDFHQHVYFTLPNNVSAPKGGLGYTQNYTNARTPSPISGYPCCCYNLHMGWPKLAQNSWAATREGGLAVMSYVPSQVSAPVANGKTASFTVDTNYPFEDTIRLKFSGAGEARFPLSLRIPGWCSAPVLAVNGKKEKTPKAGTFAIVNRAWKNGDEVVLTLPMSIETRRGVNDSLIVKRGPLLYTLRIDEKWQASEPAKVPGFESFEVTPETAWNYGLVVDNARPESSFQVQQKAAGANPFEKDQTPISLQAKARKLPQWTLQWNGFNATDPPVSPVASSAPEETVTLVPFGTQMLRVTNFPTIGAPTSPTTFRDSFANGHFDDWVLYGGGWLVRDAAFGPSADVTGSHAVAPAARFADFSYEAEVATGDNGDAGLTFRVNNPCIGDDAYTGYYLGLSAQKGIAVLGRANGQMHNGFTPIQTVPLALKPHTFTKVRVEAKGAQIKVWVDDMTKPLIEATDTNHTEGAIGLRQYGGKKDAPREGEFRNIRVTKLA